MSQGQESNSDQLVEEIKDRINALPVANVPAVRGIRREISRRLARSEPGQVVELALRLVNEPGLRWVAYELVNQHKAALSSLDTKTLEGLGQGINSWDAVDTFSVYLAGPAWRERQVADSVVHAWASSPDRWWRRTALVSTVALNNKARGGTGDVDRTIAVCRLLIDDYDDMVVKALSWALRELIKHDSEAVAGFLEEYDSSLAARVKREVRNKLDTGLKNPRGG